MRWIRLLHAGVVVALAALGGTALAPAADAYPLEVGNLTVTGTLAPGSTVTVSGGGFTPGARVGVAVFSVQHELASFVADAEGEFAGSVTLPEHLDAGRHVLQAIGPAPDGGTRLLFRYFTVARPHRPHRPHHGGKAPCKGDECGPHGGHLASTGTSTPVIPATAIGGACLFTGVALLLLVRRRVSVRRRNP